MTDIGVGAGATPPMTAMLTTAKGIPRLVNAAAGGPRVPTWRRSVVWRFLARMSADAWLILDWAIIGLSTALAWQVLTHLSTRYDWLAKPWLVCGTLCIDMSVAGLVFGLYERKTLLARSRVVVRSILTAALGNLLGFASLSVFFYTPSSRWFVLIVAVSYLLMSVPIRLAAHELITRTPVRLLCIGNGPSIHKLVALLGRMHRQSYEIVGHLRPSPGPLRLVAASIGPTQVPRLRSEGELNFFDACPCIGALDEVTDLLAEHAVDEIVVGTELAFDSRVGAAVGPCLERNCRVTDQATFVEKLLGEVPAESISADWFLRADVQNRGNYETVSRALDVLMAILGLALSLPFWPVLALLVRLDSPGPAFFRQLRVGRYGRYFFIHKFRTMRADAERHGAQWAEAKDQRVTRIGRFLRRSRLDELPQLLNILKGDMSFVGPRPERPEFVRNLERTLPHYRLRHLIKPGLTGWAQIHMGYGASVADAYRKLCHDLYYLKHRSLELDLVILIRTLGTFALGSR